MGRQLMPLLHGVGRGSGRGETVGAGVRGYREGREGAAPLRSYGLQPRASAPRRARHGSARATDRRGRHGDRQLVKRDGLSRGQGARSTAIGGRLRRADAHARATARWSANAHGHARSSSPGLCLRATCRGPRHLQSIKDPCNKPLKLTPWRLLDRLGGLDYTESRGFAAAHLNYPLHGVGQESGRGETVGASVGGCLSLRDTAVS